MKTLGILAGRQGGEGRLMSATVKQRKTGVEDVTRRPEEGHLIPDVKAANEMTCDYVWDKLYPPISVTCYKWYIRKAPFVLGAQSLDMSPESLSACLINLLLKSFGAL
jgi:hypothetical protein